MTLTIEASNGGDDRAPRTPASHRSKLDEDDADEAPSTRGYAPRADGFFASFGVITSERDQ
jgi:hypothetical protein